MGETATTFAELGLSAPLPDVLARLGYEAPSPIQARAIPLLLTGRDLLGQAQTGTGKTAAFALPILQQLDLAAGPEPQALVLVPTRELALQVAEAFQRYAEGLAGFHVLPIYGGQGYEHQLRALRRGVHVVVGTPGRVIDHLRKGTLRLTQLRRLVLDEADEMLRMGFIEDVEWILSQTPAQRQIALFSATMPPRIAAVAESSMREPERVVTTVSTQTAPNIRQRYWPAGGMPKLDALTRLLEAEPFDAMIIFVRTKTATVELAERLEARGWRAAALNGDIPQGLREQTVEKLRRSALDVLVATDVAARGLDVERITHVLNYDIPHDPESYVHRIGRTGRAGRAGEAILFAGRREMRMLRLIERTTGQRIEPMRLPSNAALNDQRIERFKAGISETLANTDISLFRGLLEEYQLEHDSDPLDIAAALATLAQGYAPFLLPAQPAERGPATGAPHRAAGEPAPAEQRRPGETASAGRMDHRDRPGDAAEGAAPPRVFRAQIGREDGLTPGQLVAALIQHGGLEAAQIGDIRLQPRHTTLELPDGLPAATLERLQTITLGGKPLALTPLGLARSRPAATRPQRKSHGAPGRGEKPRRKGPGTGYGKGGKAGAKRRRGG